MNRILSVVFLVIGVTLIVYGVNASHSIGSGFSRFFTGSPTDKTVWLLVGGAVASVVGISGLIPRSKA